jgi:hypothetical protein
MKNKLLILLLCLSNLICFGQNDSIQENIHSKKEVEKIVKEIKLIYEEYESLIKEDESLIGDLYNMSVCTSHSPIPGIGEEIIKTITYFGDDKQSIKSIIDISSGYNYSHEELIYFSLNENTYNQFREFKYLTDDYEGSLIFYYTTNANKIGESSYLDPNEIPDAEPDFNDPSFHTIRAYYYKDKLIKVIVTNKETENKKTHYYPFKVLNPEYLKKLQNL